MKNLIIISSAALLFAGSQICGCGTCSQANAQTTIPNTIVQSAPKTVTLKITGMTCAGCANHISTALDKIEGILEQEVKYPGDVAVVKYDPNKTTEEAIIKAITKTGYKAEVLKEEEKQSLENDKKSCAPNCAKSCCAKK